MKQPIRFFSIGLLTSAILLSGFYFFFDTSKENIENIPVEEMIAKVEEDGYRVITEDEFISYSLSTEKENADKDEKETAGKDKEQKNSKKDDEKSKEKEKKQEDGDKKEKKKNKEDEEDEKEKVKKVTFTTEEGVVSQDIADILIENDIIDDRQKFLDYLDDNDYSPYIQLGTFKVTSDMSMKELAETVTTYPGN